MNKAQIQPSELLATPGGLLALGFGSGLLPWMPGTWGTLFAVPFALLLLHLDPGLQLGILVVLMVVGVFVCDRTSKNLAVATTRQSSGMKWSAMAVPYSRWNPVCCGWCWLLSSSVCST